MKRILIAFSSLIIALSVSKSTGIRFPNFQSSAELSNYVKHSLQKDLETVNLLDRAMATPLRRTKSINRKLKKNNKKSKHEFPDLTKSKIAANVNFDTKNSMINRMLTLAPTVGYLKENRHTRQLEDTQELNTLDSLADATEESDQRRNLISDNCD